MDISLQIIQFGVPVDAISDAYNLSIVEWWQNQPGS